MGALLTLIVAGILEFLIIAGLSWVGCWALGLLGITVIWTWSLALGVFVLVELIRIIF